MGGIVKRVAKVVVLLALLGVASCGEQQSPGVREPPSQEPPAREPTDTVRSARPPTWAKVSLEQITAAKKHGVPVAFENDLGMRFVLIPAGTFLMGSPEGRPNRSRSKPQHEVTLTRPFYMQITEVTNEAYRRHRPDHDAEELTRQNAKTRITMIRTTESYPGHDGPELNEDRQPVTCVSWFDATAFAAWLTEQGRGRSYGLPTEAEWEYACRAGTRTANAFGETLTNEQARFLPDPRSDRWRVSGLAEVGGYSPNAWGLRDMHGNALEWCADWFGSYAPSRTENPRGPEKGTRKVIRGGCAYTKGSHVGSAERWMMPPDHQTGWGSVGFRLLSPLPDPKSGK